MNGILLATPVICAVLAGVLAWKEKQGWGWFLFAAIVISCGMSANKF
ncbi:hypothetical protein AABH71_005122 [Salmonella enterica]